MVTSNSSDVLASFRIPSTEVEIEDPKNPTKMELTDLFHKLMTNLSEQVCVNLDWGKVGWAIVVILNNLWIGQMLPLKNQAIKEEELATAILAESDVAIKNALHIDHATVKALWEPKLLDENSRDVQLPQYDKNPGLFKINSSWTDKQRGEEKIKYKIQKDLYETYVTMDRAASMYIKHSIDAWSMLG